MTLVRVIVRFRSARKFHRLKPRRRASHVVGVLQNSSMAKPTQEQLKNLHAALNDVDKLVSPDGAKHFALANPGSSLAADDQLLHPLRTSHMIGHCLSMAEDQLRALRKLLTDYSGEYSFSFPMAAHNSNIRSSLECSSLAIWLLGPNEQEERLRRSLRSRQYELNHEKALYQTLTSDDINDPPATRKKHARDRQRLMKAHQGQKQLLQQAANQAGIELDTLEAFPGFREIVGEASSTLGLPASHGSGLWQAVSGLSHPSALRQINMADREIVGGEGESLNVLFTASTTSVLAGVLAATRHFEGALLITELRGATAD